MIHFHGDVNKVENMQPNVIYMDKTNEPTTSNAYYYKF